MSNILQKLSQNRKRFFNQPRQNQPNDTNNNDTRALPDFIPQIEINSYNKPTRNLLKEPCLSIIERTINILKGHCCTRLVSVINGLLSMYNREPKKRSVRLELISLLLLNLNNDDVDFNGIRNQLDDLFWPKALKEIMIDVSDLHETLEVEEFFGIALRVITGEGYLKKKRGGSVKVLVRRVEHGKDDLSLLREAKLLSRLRHESIVRILALDASGPRMVLEYMSEGKLCDMLEEYYFSGQKLFRFLRQIASGMSYLADNKYVLRNLDSENILLDASGRCKISNLQCCRYVGDTGGVYVDWGNDVDVNFAAPEVRKDRRFSAKTDVWDLGLLGWELFLIEPSEIVFGGMSRLYKKLSYLNTFISSDYLAKPSRCPLPLWYFLRSRLLATEPAGRPTFLEVVEAFKEFEDLIFIF